MGRRFRVEFTPDQLAYARGLPGRVEYRFGSASSVPATPSVDQLPAAMSRTRRSQDRSRTRMAEGGARSLSPASADGPGQGVPGARHLEGPVPVESWVGAVVPVPRRQAHAGAAAVQAVGARELAEVRPGAVPVDPIGMAPTRMRPIIRKLVRITGESLLSTDRRSQ